MVSTFSITAGVSHAVSLNPGATVDDVLALVNSGAGCSVNDSFARLDLRSRGFTVLFDAQWIHRQPGSAGSGPQLSWHVVSTPAELARFAASHGNRAAFVDVLLTVEDVRLLAALDNDVVLAGMVLNSTGPVVGVSNLFAPATARAKVEFRTIWADVVAVAGKLFPGAPLVGYQTAEDFPPALEAGFHAAGPLRVWIS